MSQLEVVSLEELVSPEHLYRKYQALWDFRGTARLLNSVEKDNNYKGYGILRLFKCLLLQYMEDLSDRELEMFLRDNVSSKWFCGFGLTEVTPDYTVFTRV